ncbi:App1 family protein [Tellurirhabdus bombi]|uniref:App1 family protein n=1 Tax=Tellurirhabdus bombi TaxID=2907205 RepID=UPI001F24689E|nr:phosphatase domain-containing protein [Tellurirhabdus bombi]
MSNNTSLGQKFLTWLRVTNQPVVKVYRGYGHANQAIIYGHVLHHSPLPRQKYRDSVAANTLGLLRMFFVRPYVGAKVRLANNPAVHTTTETDGFFKLEWTPEQPLAPGWHPIRVELSMDNEPPVWGEGQLFVPHPTQYGCISDIDDTFLISHSSNLRKRLRLLLTENARTRDAFADVVDHYRLLTHAGTIPHAPNPFFYVSSSEWNLYDYLIEFSNTNGLPMGVYLLSQIKRLPEVFKTGQGKHMTKFMRIVRVLDAYPKLRFILLGDDTQEDPDIYASVVSHFPQQIVCVYLRQVEPRKQEKTRFTVQKIQDAGVPCCYFRDSAEAIRHTKEIGLLPTEDANNQFGS